MRRRILLAHAALGACGLAGLWPGAARPAPEPAQGETVIAVVARKFVFLPNEITLRRGESVLLEFSAPEVVMGFYAPELGLRAVIVPGQVTRLRYLPDRIGRFDFLCDIFCGDGHEGMSGHITVIG